MILFYLIYAWLRAENKTKQKTEDTGPALRNLHYAEGRQKKHIDI